MAQRQLSRTLPKNFTFPSLNLDEPKTPERPTSPFKVPARPQNISNARRRLRGETISAASRDVSACIDLDLFQFRGLPDVPLPSIEVGQSSAPVESSIGHQPINDERYLAPPRQRLMFKTPPAQIRGAEFESTDETQPWPSWDQTPLPHDIPRPGSACSTMSDSSVESIETYASRPSIGGSCSSVESDIFEPYFPIEINKDAELSSPTLPKKKKVQRSQVKSTSWTRDMDNHLWNTYQIYLQDPTMTPFKMTPGSIPPLGVTTRVARRAKKTWEKKHRLIKSLPTQTSDRSGSSTPTAIDGAVSRVSWPKSDAKTRHRLKNLCRRKFSIMPHYHRMMQSCSPEPAENEEDSQPAYGTRDLGVSLITSFASNPLSQFAEEPAPEIKPEQPINPVQSNVAFPPIPPFNQHLNVDPSSIPRLGSPFVYSTWGPGGSNRQMEGVPLSARRETVHVPNRVRRNTHFAMTPRDPDDVFSPKAYVDNDPSDEEVHRRLNDYMRENKGQNIVDGRARVPRSRGLTTGAVSRSRDVSQLFSPPSSLNSSQIEPEETTPVTKPPVNPLLNLGGEHIKRLGSPFKAEGGFKRRTAPGRFIRHAPSLSDPFCNIGFPAYPGSMGPSPIQEQPKPQGPPPSLQNPFEEGLSDAERIRRQILNMHSTRN